MATISRNHHWIPQFYLKGFAKSPGKNAQVYVVDAVAGRSFMTAPKNVAVERDFNRVDVDGIAPDHIESGYAQFEGVAAAALRRLCERREFGSVEDHNLILNLIALLAMRNPRAREHWRRTRETLLKRTVDVAMATPTRFEKSMANAVRDGFVPPDHGLSFAEIRDFIEQDRYTIEVSTTQHVEDELRRIDVILPLLGQRHWILLRAAPGSGGFVTTDHPVILDWTEDRARGGFYPPGYGLRNTEVIFPVSQGLVMHGTFDGRHGGLDIDADLVARINTDIIRNAQRQVYARDERFRYMLASRQVRMGGDLLRDVSAVREYAP
ncbi:MAG: DUF4238 domain-containing protein [Burkholderiaceae bacterium]|nr:DUF4238 domain-containing protein [Burkholderiaceae bacterium]